MLSFKIVIAEDDKWYSELLKYQLSLNDEYEVVCVSTGKELLKTLSNNPQVVTLDYSLPDFNGSELLKKIKQSNPHTEVIIVSGQEDVKTAISLLKEGAYDYIVKDEETKERIWKTIANIRSNSNLKAQVEKLKDEVVKKYDFSKTIVGSSEALKNVFSLIGKASQSSINVSLSGETGTGKEVVAKAIHYNSNRKKAPFVAINVSAIPSELIESELFGHEKGAFTGANAKRIGKFEQAKGGTIFLDEIGEMDMQMQAKLLRVLQEREVVRVGGEATVKIDCRVICATHKKLIDEVHKGNFREDLFYRLMGLSIELPPLRDRKEDVILLAKHFIKEFAKENNFKVKTFHESAVKKLLNYRFPGNIRELKAIVDLSMVLSDEEQILSEHIQITAQNPNNDLMKEEMTLKAYNERILDYYLEKYNKNVLKVASVLDIGKSTIYRMLKEK
jgi:two-component system response regulator AtoC